MKIRINKLLALCFVCSLSLGAVTSCDKDDDNNKKDTVLNNKTVAEQGREDGKELARIVLAAQENPTSVIAEANTAVALAKKYRESEDKVYKGAFAEGAAEAGLLGDTSTGDDAISALDKKLESLEGVLGLLGNLNK